MVEIPSGPSQVSIEAAVDARSARYLEDLRELVDTDCGTYDKDGVDVVGRWVAERLRTLGAAVTVHPHETLGDTISADYDSGVPGPTIVLLGHLDTVFATGTVALRPFAIRDGRAYGPGVSDMKSGLLSGLHAIEVLRAIAPDGVWPNRGRVVFIANTDEEIGSPSSTPIIRRLASGADAALVLEAARADGSFVVERKGMLGLGISFSGRAAHAGVEPDKGRSAVLEAAHKTIALHALNGRWDDVSVNVGVAEGGTRSNIVAPTARLGVDIRASTMAHLEAVETAAHEVIETTIVDGVEVSTDVLMRWAPMERNETSERLVEIARGLAGGLGIEFRTAATGGASDGNTTSSMGVPTLDGLGPVGGGAHADDEYLDVGSIVPRTTLLATLLAALETGAAFESS